MKSRRYLSALMLLIATNTVLAQGQTTIITTVNGEVSNVTQVENPPPERTFNTFAETDADKNGQVDPAEARNAGILAFSSADLDNNGWLDNGEYNAVATGMTKLPTTE